MSRPVARSLASLGLLVGALLVPQSAGAGDPCFHSMERPAPTTGSTVAIGIGDCVFLPTVSHVAVGATVEWRNGSSQAHEVVGANLTWGAHDKLLQPGDSIGWSFPEPGVFAYSCMLHPGMTGAIVVEPTAATTGSREVAPAAALTPTGGSPNDVGRSLAPIAGLSAAAVAVLGLALARRGRRVRVQ